VDFSVIDHFEKVTDRDAAIATREIVRQEGIWVGNSAGSAIAGLLQLKQNFKAGEVIVVIFHDHGTRYLGKMFNPEWMQRMGYADVPGLRARDLVRSKKVAAIVALEQDESIRSAIAVMRDNDFSQVPVSKDRRLVGSLHLTETYARVIDDPALLDQPIKTIMQKAFRFVDINTPVSLLAPMIGAANPAVIVRDFPARQNFILTNYDVLAAI